MTLRCFFFGHDVNAIPVLRADRLCVKCGRCGRISPGIPMVTRPDQQPAIYESRQILRLVKRA